MSFPESQPPPGHEPPSPPPPPPPPSAGSKSSLRRALEWALALAVLIIPMGIAYLRKSEGDSAYAIGYAFGTAAAVVLLALVAAKLYSRFGSRGSEPPLAGAVAAVALLAIGAQFVLKQTEGSAAVSDFNELADACEADDPEPFATAGPGWTLVELSPAERTAFVSNASSVMPDGISAERYVVQRVVVDGRVLGAAAAYPGVGSDASVLAGFEAGVTAEVPAVVSARGCWGVAVIARSRGDTEAIAARLLAG
jgi:hypothetical protein